MAEPLKVGDRIWLFDRNHRVYRKDDASGRRSGSPIFAEHFRPYVITGETKVSWLVGDTKVNKNTMRSATGGYGMNDWHTEASREAAIWLDVGRVRIHDAVMRCQDVDVLKRIDALLKGARDD